jgi:MFS family permease
MTPDARSRPADRDRGGTRAALAPLAHPVFRALWIAQLVSNVGTWMQTVGAQWLMVELDAAPVTVALVQTATLLPVVLIAYPAGALADILDRRALLIAAQLWMLASATALAIATATGVLGPVGLLALTFSLGIGAAVTLPTRQAITPELVEREEIPRAAALGAASMNVARSVGPAIGGVIVVLGGPEAVFALNAVSFLAVVGVLIWWRREPSPRPLGAEPVDAALRTGIGFVRASPRLRWLLARTGLFVLASSALIALLPLVASDELGLGAGGYGALLGAFGVGAVAGALSLHALRARRSLDTLVAVASIVLALVAGTIGTVGIAPVAGLALLVGGACWTVVLSTLNAAAQTLLPDWVRARGMAVFVLVLQGGMAAGAAGWGVLATFLDLRVALVASGVALATTLAAARRLPIRHGEALDLTPVSMGLPETADEPGPGEGPVLITVVYRVPAENLPAFTALLTRMGRSRRRTGARRWSLWRDPADPERLVETFVVATWGEHMRQHLERTTVTEHELFARVRALLSPGTAPEVAHQIAVVRGPAPARPTPLPRDLTGGPPTPSV